MLIIEQSHIHQTAFLFIITLMVPWWNLHDKSGLEFWLSQCCTVLGDELLEDWVRFSRKSVSFREGACEAKWTTFNDEEYHSSAMVHDSYYHI